MKKIIAILFILLFSAAFLVNKVSAQQTTVNLEAIAGEYIYSSGYVGATYKITGDAKYEYSSFSDCCDPVWQESGSFELKNNVLHFKINKKTLNRYNLLDPKEATEAFKKLYHATDEVKAEDIETEYDLQLIKWGERLYLIEPARLPMFTGAVNLGIEPRARIINDNFLTTRFFLRSGDESKAVSGAPILPEEFKSYLPAPAIDAKITDIALQAEQNVYTINKGSVDGLNLGMFLLRDEDKPDYDNLLCVFSIGEHSAKLKSYGFFHTPDFKVNDMLTTKSMKSFR